ncbi:MAG: N-acetyl-alpha-D-glucosaminyl L-malate synthase BshA [Acidobacteria bacterium]|nr:MAG: N-acetyl-alpha-D-glucosaminyl L-malate synthase BshA [Acidobacteriota bacterium]REJ98690.1 MAG: N-acetyl-alpha-D-glucosaminyl L-malate synthase BshA [Acidobacteriota bacterium]REK16654.1 MAG: N-acetyl-alpha-D-glucosaminyl L-malate synthase BshA [Acidobacteriota bacterium]REK42565.1 MAG: N-acetyl-alpha-D-glucosaminyl L-malate synthase BshA [Acidobacteriota bacterium]
MNIGITVYPTYGGSGIVGSELGAELAQRGHNVHFISSTLPSRLTELTERIHFHEVEMMTYPLFEHQPYSLALATKMATVARAERLDLLHVHYAIPHSISAILARESIKSKRYLPVITTLHGTDITLVGADRSYLPITKYGLQESDGVTAVSRFLKKATIETFDYDDIEVIPNFICPNHYVRDPESDLRKELADRNETILTHVSNFRSVKRPVDCVEILDRVLKHGAKARLVMVGDGPQRSACEYRAEQLGIKQYITFAGKKANISDYLAVSDIFLLPSELESFGLAALEALACEVPVVASRVGGIPEVVTDNETGYLSDIGDVDKMGEDALRLVNDEDLRTQFGKAGRDSAVSRYSANEIIPRYIEFYERILGARSAAAAERS